MDPEELAEVNVEDLIAENLETSDKLKILDEQGLGAALEEYVSKDQKQAINESVGDTLTQKTRHLIKRGKKGGDEDIENSIKTAAALKEILEKEAEGAARVKASIKGDMMDDDEDAARVGGCGGGVTLAQSTSREERRSRRSRTGTGSSFTILLYSITRAIEATPSPIRRGACAAVVSIASGRVRGGDPSRRVPRGGPRGHTRDGSRRRLDRRVRR